MQHETTEVVITETVTTQTPTPPKRSWLDTLTYLLLLVGVFLLPLLFVPHLTTGLEPVKMLFLSGVVSVALIVWLVRQLRARVMTLPKSGILGFGLAFVLVAFVSAVLSPAVHTSLVGFAYDLGTAASLGLFFLLLFLTAVTFRSPERVLYVYGALIASFVILFIFHIVRLIGGPDTLSFGVFFSNLSTPLGNWNDLGIFAGLMALLSFVALEFAAWGRGQKIVLYSLLGSAIVLLGIVNFYLVWVILGIFAGMMVVYNLTLGRPGGGGRRVSIPSLIVTLIAGIFIVGGSSLGGFLAERTGISQFDVRPSWTATMHIIEETWREDPVLGAGPNRFTNQWLLYKDDAINETQFWNTDFRSGIGFLPSFGVTTGILGLFALVAFLLSIVWSGVRVIFLRRATPRVHYFTFSSFLASVYLWLMAIVYVPNATTIALAFFFTGVFVAFASLRGAIRTLTIVPVGDRRVRFATLLLVIALLIVTTFVGYASFKKTIALAYVYKASEAITVNENVNSAEYYLTRAGALNSADVIYRTLVDVEQVKLRELLGEPNQDPEVVRAEFQTIVGDAIAAAQEAIKIDPMNYENWRALFRVYSDVVELNIVDGAYDNAVASLARAQVLNPKSPLLAFHRAQLEAIRGDNAAARTALGEALALKNNYTDAIIFLAQIDINDGNVAGAVEALQAAVFLNPTNPGLFFNLGFLLYSQGDFENAARAFEQAVIIDNLYSNAKYFLALSYYQQGRTDETLQQFRDLAILNPDNDEVKDAISNLESGRGPFERGAIPEVEDLEASPIEE